MRFNRSVRCWFTNVVAEASLTWLVNYSGKAVLVRERYPDRRYSVARVVRMSGGDYLFRASYHRTPSPAVLPGPLFVPDPSHTGPQEKQLADMQVEF